MKANLVIERNGKNFNVSVDVNETGRGMFTMGANVAPCQVTEATMQMVKPGRTIICEVSNLLDAHGRVVVENGKSVVLFNIVKHF